MSKTSGVIDVRFCDAIANQSKRNAPTAAVAGAASHIAARGCFRNTTRGWRRLRCGISLSNELTMTRGKGTLGTPTAAETARTNCGAGRMGGGKRAVAEMMVGLTVQRLTRAARAHVPKPTRRAACRM